MVSEKKSQFLANILLYLGNVTRRAYGCYGILIVGPCSCRWPLRRDTRRPVFPACGHMHAHNFWPAAIKFGTVTHVREGCICKRLGTPHIRRDAALHCQHLGFSATYAYTLWRRTTKFIIITHNVKPVLFACPLFRKFRDLGVFAKITGCEYIFYWQFISSVSKNAKIKGAEVIHWT